MNRLLFRFALGLGGAAAVLLVAGGVLWSRRPTPPPTLPVAAPEPEHEPTRARPARAADEALLSRARELLGRGGREEGCGPYKLYTDVDDPQLVAACGRLAARLDEVYEERYGLFPIGEPAETIVLFADISSFRAFAREGGVALGYAGYALGTKGLAVFYVGGSTLEEFLSTLTHELTHLVHRRTLGVNLPPWLSEGLADGIGDTATHQGIGPLVGVAGSEAQARRLREAYESGRARSLKRLVELRRSEFDRGTVSFDYEQSALFVRFLLAEPERAAAFRELLRDFAQGQVDLATRLPEALGVDFPELDRLFEAWLREQVP